MSTVVFFTWPGGGNQPPAIGLARQLAERGHSVVFAGYPPQIQRFSELGLPLTPMAGASQGWGPVEPSTVMGLLRDRVWSCADHPADLRAVLDREHPDLLIVDCLMLGLLSAAESAGVPTKVLVHSAPGALAPPTGPFDQLNLPSLNAIRADLGLSCVDSSWAAWSRHEVVAASIPELDPLADRVRLELEQSRLTWIGPVDGGLPAPRSTASEPASEPVVDPAEDRTRSVPRVLVSFSSGPAWDQTSRIQRTIDALAGENVEVLVTSGAVNPQDVRVMSDNVVVVPYRPHVTVLPDTAVVVSHGGHGTLTAALTHALPLVLLPNPAADQPALAHQVETLGAGIDLDGERASAQDIRDAVRAVLGETGYRAAAAEIAGTIASYQDQQRQGHWLG